LNGYQESRVSTKKYTRDSPSINGKIIPYMATEKQLKLLRNLGIKPEKYLSKIEANRLISKAQR
jgi:hypothetical protein